MVEQLPTYKKTKNAIYRLIERCGSTILYEVLWHTGVTYYEVMAPRICDQHRFQKRLWKRFPERTSTLKDEQYKEVWPKDKEGGKHYWFYPTLESAREKYEELLAKQGFQK